MNKIEFVNNQEPSINAENLNAMQDNIESVGVPVGAIMGFGGLSAPTGWLLCDGQAVSRETYAELFSVIGTYYGSGDGSTTFNVPNRKGRVGVGYDNTQDEFNSIGKKSGEKSVTLTVQQIPPHKHSVNTIYPFTAGNKYTGVPNSNASSYYNTNDTGVVNNTGGGQPHNNLQPYEVENYIIKY